MDERDYNPNKRCMENTFVLKYKRNKEKKETLRWKGKSKSNIRKSPIVFKFLNAWEYRHFNPCCKLRFGLPNPKTCFADYYDDLSGAAKRNRNEIREKIKTDYRYRPKKVIWKGIYLKLMVFCLFVCIFQQLQRKEQTALTAHDWRC